MSHSVMITIGSIIYQVKQFLLYFFILVKDEQLIESTLKSLILSSSSLGPIPGPLLVHSKSLTPGLLRLQLKTPWTGGILTGKITFLRDMCLTKVVQTMKTNILNISNSCQIDTLSSKTPTPEFVDWVHLDREILNIPTPVCMAPFSQSPTPDSVVIIVSSIP